MDGGPDIDEAPPPRPDAEERDPWAAFLTPETGTDFVEGWLRITGARVADATAGVVFMQGDAGRLGAAGLWNMEGRDTAAIAALAEAVLKTPEPRLTQIDSGETLLGYPIDVAGAVEAVLVLVLARPLGRRMRAVMRELHWASGWIEARLWQGRAQIGSRSGARAKLALDLMAAAEEHARFDGAALALVNAVPDLTGFDQAALGMVKGRRVRLEALSRAATFKKRATLVRAYEAAMDEVLGQADILTYPPQSEHRRMVDIAHARLADDTGAGAILSVPLQVRGQVVGVLMLMRRRSPDGALVIEPQARDDLALAAAAVAPGLATKLSERRWISGRGRWLAGRALTAVFGRRPAIGLGTAVAALCLAVPFFVTTEIRVKADATLLGAEQRVAVAPVDGFIAEAFFRAGDRVTTGDVLARLDDRDLQLELAANQARRDEARQSVREALAGTDRGAAAIAAADLAEADAALRLTQSRLALLDIRAPMPGLLVQGDLSQQLGAPVSRGDALFEIAAETGYRVQIDVDEVDLGLVAPGQSGTVVFSGLIGTDIPVTLTRIANVSTPEAGENRFRAEAEVTVPADGLRPGLTGTAKIVTGEGSLAWAWARRGVNRLRLLLWRIGP